MRRMSIDYGDVRTGIALADLLGITVYGLETITDYKNDKKILKRVEEIVEEYGVTDIVLGMPYNENGTSGERVEKTLAFKHKLKCKFNKLNIYEQDERYTSLWAEEEMIHLNVKKKNKKKVIDQLAAVNILKTFNDNEKNRID